MRVPATLVRALNRHVLPRWQLVLRKSGHDDNDQILTPKYRDMMLADACALLPAWMGCGQRARNAPSLRNNTTVMPSGEASANPLRSQ